jgi:hypothetical protein
LYLTECGGRLYKAAELQSPREIGGLTTMNGKKPAACEYPAVKKARHFWRDMIWNQFDIMELSLVLSRSVSALSPPSGATSSVFSRSRTRTNRKSAS